MLKDSSSRYGALSRLLHWVVALLVIHQFVKFIERIDGGEEWVKEYLGSNHGSIGLLILGLVVVRLLWVLSQRERPATEGFLGLCARVGHGLLYLFMFLAPLSAIALLVGNGWGLRFFGYELVARSPEKIEWLLSFGRWHAEIAIAFAVLVVVHIAAALYHHFVKGDDTLRRMTRG